MTVTCNATSLKTKPRSAVKPLIEGQRGMIHWRNCLTRSLKCQMLENTLCHAIGTGLVLCTIPLECVVKASVLGDKGEGQGIQFIQSIWFVSTDPILVHLVTQKSQFWPSKISKILVRCSCKTTKYWQISSGTEEGRRTQRHYLETACRTEAFSPSNILMLKEVTDWMSACTD